jgi:hypothetical protein
MRKLRQARSLASLLLWAIFHPVAVAQTAAINTTVDPILLPVSLTESIQDQITSVNQLADGQPTDGHFKPCNLWLSDTVAFLAIQTVPFVATKL